MGQRSFSANRVTSQNSSKNRSRILLWSKLFCRVPRLPPGVFSICRILLNRNSTCVLRKNWGFARHFATPLDRAISEVSCLPAHKLTHLQYDRIRASFTHRSCSYPFNATIAYREPGRRTRQPRRLPCSTVIIQTPSGILQKRLSIRYRPLNIQSSHCFLTRP